MERKHVHVDAYSGYKAEERPLRLWLGERALEVEQVEDRWYSPGFTFFRVRVAGGDRYILRHDDAQDAWTLEAYRAGRLPLALD